MISEVDSGRRWLDPGWKVRCARRHAKSNGRRRPAPPFCADQSEETEGLSSNRRPESLAVIALFGFSCQSRQIRFSGFSLRISCPASSLPDHVLGGLGLRRRL